MECIQVEDKIHELIHGLLKKEEEKEILRHIEECEKCKRLYEIELLLEENLKNIPPVSPPSSLRYEILKRIEKKRKFIPALKWAPAFATLIILISLFLLTKGKKVELLEASVFQVELVMPKEGSTFFTDNVKIVATLFPEGKNVEIEAYLDEKDISNLFEIKDGVLIYKPSYVEEGYHRIQILARDLVSGELRKMESVFYTIGG